MKRHACLFVLILGALAPVSGQTDTELSLLGLSVESYPEHGLPGIPPVLKLTVRNGSATPIILPSIGLHLEGARPDGSIFAFGGESDIQDRWVSPDFIVGTDTPSSPVTIPAKGIQVCFVSQEVNGFFYDAPLMQPGRYDIRFRFSFGGAASNVFRYTVDAPEGEDRLVWNAWNQKATAEGFYAPYAHERWFELFGAHPASTYSKVWHYYRDLVQGRAATQAAQVQRVQEYVNAGPPEPFDAAFRVLLAIEQQTLAEQSAVAGRIDEAEMQADQGRSVLTALALSRNPFAVAQAESLLKNAPWTRQQLIDFVEARKPQPLKPITPEVDCVQRNTDRTYTAWFGYSNPNNGVPLLPIGPENHFSGAPADRGQPTVFELGTHTRVASVKLNAGERVSWTLNGTTVKAEAREGGDVCPDDVREQK
jgi:hypothetical protein